jgi:hypothetical protein
MTSVAQWRSLAMRRMPVAVAATIAAGHAAAPQPVCEVSR